MHILFALDSFKGCLCSTDACASAAAALRDTSHTYGCLSVSDGGEGLTSILTEANRGRLCSVQVHNPRMECMEATYGISNDGSTAYLEVAAASGLALLSPEQRDPLCTTSFGTGELLREALKAGARTILLGLGGSATNDAGVGLLQALGFQFLSDHGDPLPPGATGKDLASIVQICPPEDLPPFTLIAPCDVRAPLYGPMGAAYVFAPQKGATPEAVLQLDSGLRNIASLWPEAIATTPGAGAAGGIGAGILACLNAQLTPGIDLVLDAIHLENALRTADWIVTGEGHSDAQTLMGKVPSGIAERAHRAGVRVALLSGGISDAPALRTHFDYVASINPPDLPLSIALQPETARANLALATARFLQAIAPSNGHPSHRMECNP